MKGTTLYINNFINYIFEISHISSYSSAELTILHDVRDSANKLAN